MATPVLLILYPVVIALIILGFLKSVVKVGRTGMYAGAVYATLVVSFLETVASYANLAGLAAIIGAFPLASYGFAWVVPAILGGVIGFFVTKNSENPLAREAEE